MLKRVVVTSLFLFVVVLLGMTATMPSGPEVKLRTQQSASSDSLIMRMQWTESVPLRGTSQVEGYEWEFNWAMDEYTLWSSLPAASGTTATDYREATAMAPATCGDTIYMQARARPTGLWVMPAEWGYSSVLTFFCEDLPPLPPVIIDLDTIPEFPMDEWPLTEINSRSERIHLDVLPVAVGPTTTWSLSTEEGSTTLSFSATYETSTLCAFVIRDGIIYKALKEYTDITGEAVDEFGNPIGVDNDIETAPVPGRLACVYATALYVDATSLLADW